jgi:hypothetical protein
MPDYRRYRIPGGTYFFTVNLLERHPNDLLIRPINVLRQGVKVTNAGRGLQPRPKHFEVAAFLES